MYIYILNYTSLIFSFLLLLLKDKGTGKITHFLHLEGRKCIFIFLYSDLDCLCLLTYSPYLNLFLNMDYLKLITMLLDCTKKIILFV